jgi:hypothetical protein
VIKENPGIRLWHIKPKLKKIHRDWHVSRYVLIRHVLGLYSSKLIIIQPKARIDDLKKLLEDYRNLRKDERLVLKEETKKCDSEHHKDLKIARKNVESLVERVSRKTLCYPAPSTRAVS